MPSGTVAERKPFRNGTNNLESNEHLESKRNYMMSKVVGYCQLFMHLLPDIKILSEKLLLLLLLIAMIIESKC